VFIFKDSSGETGDIPVFKVHLGFRIDCNSTTFPTDKLDSAYPHKLC